MFRKIQQNRFQRSNMSLEKESSDDTSGEKSTTVVPTNVGVVTHLAKSKRVHLTASEGVSEEGVALKTLLWKGLFPTTPNERVRYLTFRNIEYIISGWAGDGFPSIIYIAVDGVNGFFDSTLTQTNRVAALELSEVQAVYDESQTRTYELKYVLRECITWEVPVTFTTVNIRMFIDNETTAIVLPLVNPITLNFEVRVE